MPLKDILVHTDNSKNSIIRLEYAARLAQVHKAYVTGLYVAGSTRSGKSQSNMANYVLPDFGSRSLREYEKRRTRWTRCMRNTRVLPPMRLVSASRP